MREHGFFKFFFSFIIVCLLAIVAISTLSEPASCNSEMEEGYSVSGLSLSPRYFIVLDTQFKKDILQYIGFFEGKHVFRRTLFGKQIGLLSLYTKLDIGGEIKIGDEYRFKLVDVECDNAILNITYSRPFRVERFPLKERPKLRV